MVDVYKNDAGEIAVLIGTKDAWSYYLEPELAYDKRVVELYLGLRDRQKSDLCFEAPDDNNTATRVFESLRSFGYFAEVDDDYPAWQADCIADDLMNCKIEWVKPGEPFHISLELNEYGNYPYEYMIRGFTVLY